MAEYDFMPDPEPPVHPVANWFPLVEGDNFAALITDIDQNGMNNPITLSHDGDWILDGRNRLRAWKSAPRRKGERPPVDYLAADVDEVKFILSQNVIRRHMIVEQTAYIAARLSNTVKGTNQHEGKIQVWEDKTTVRSSSPIFINALTQKEAAEQLGLSTKTVHRAQIVLKNGTPAFTRCVFEQGNCSLLLAEQIAKENAELQDKLARLPKADLEKAYGKVIAGRKRRQRLGGMGGGDDGGVSRETPEWPRGRYGVILADPAWKFEVRDEETGETKRPPYRTMTLEELRALDVPAIATDNCVLFMWATTPMKAQAIELMAAWQFDYKSAITWRKDKVGTGFWFRDRGEELLLGTRGDVPAPERGTQWESVVDGPVREHSQKPDWQYDLVEAYFPGVAKIELFYKWREGVAQREGWDVWGDEAHEPAEAA